MFVKTFFFFFFFGEHLRLCPWPRECLSSERLSLALASDFFCVLGLEPCVLDSTSALHVLTSDVVWLLPFPDSTCFYCVTMHSLFSGGQE